MGHTSAGQVVWYVNQDRFVLSWRQSVKATWCVGGILLLQGAVPAQTQTIYGGVGFISWCLRRPFLGKCGRGSRHFWNCRRCVGFDPACGHLKKRPCAICVWLVGCPTNTRIVHLSLRQDEYNCAWKSHRSTPCLTGVRTVSSYNRQLEI